MYIDPTYRYTYWVYIVMFLHYILTLPFDTNISFVHFCISINCKYSKYKVTGYTKHCYF